MYFKTFNNKNKKEKDPLHAVSVYLSVCFGILKNRRALGKRTHPLQTCHLAANI